jgi:hypothetical protein
METWGVVFLGVIAVAMAVQAAFIVTMSLAIIRLAQRVDSLQDKIDRQIGPALEGLDRVSRNAAEISDLATVQARRIDLLLADTIERVDDTVNVVQRLVARPLRPVSHLLAVLRGVQRGLDVFLQLERKDRSSRPEGRRSGEDDEHLFI